MSGQLFPMIPSLVKLLDAEQYSCDRIFNLYHITVLVSYHYSVRDLADAESSQDAKNWVQRMFFLRAESRTQGFFPVTRPKNNALACV